MRLFIMLSLISFSAFALDWSDLEVGKSYKLTKLVSLTQKERSRSIIDLPAGTTVELESVIGLSIPGAPLAVFIFDLPNCPGKDMVTEVEVIDVEGTDPHAQVGVGLETDCELDAYVELKDYYSKSLFE